MRLYAIPCAYTPARCLSIATLSALLSTAALSQTPGPTSDGSAPAKEIPTEILVAPHLSRPLSITYPWAELQEHGEGWVDLGMMVDPTGKPFEVTVNSSSGNKVFEKQAIEAVERATFKPGLLNGQTIESASEFKVVFRLEPPLSGARHEFVQQYRILQNAIMAKDRSAADAAMQGLDVKNLYEDAYFGLGSYEYALVWGDEAQQLAGLQRAIAREKGAQYWSKSDMQSLQRESLLLNVKLRHYVEALDLWTDLLKAGIDSATKAKLEPMIQRVENIRRVEEPYALSRIDAQWDPEIGTV